MPKSADAYRTISEAAEELKVPQHVLRFWETRFPQIRPLKRGGNRRFYRPDDVELLSVIKRLLYKDGFTIKGVQRILNDRGPRAVAGLAAAQAGSGTDGAGVTPAEEAACDDARGPDLADPATPGDTLDRLQEVLFEVSECRRILAAVRE